MGNKREEKVEKKREERKGNGKGSDRRKNKRRDGKPGTSERENGCNLEQCVTIVESMTVCDSPGSQQGGTVSEYK